MNISRIINHKNKIHIIFPYSAKDSPSYFGPGEMADILSFGYSYVEHADHCVEFLLVSPDTARRIIREINDVIITFDTEYIGMLWTAGIFVTDKVKNNSIIFSNNDQSVVLDLNTNKIEGDYHGNL